MKSSIRKAAYLFGALVLAFGSLVGLRSGAGETAKNIRIIYSNDTLGYVEPCGCGGRDEGGLARRATLISRLTKENPNCVIVETGNVCDREEKLDLITSILSELHYDAIGLGMYDFRLGEDFYKAASSHKLTVLDASPKAHQTSLPYTIKVVDGVKVGIISFNNFPYGSQDEFALRRSTYTAYNKLRESCDVLIVMDQADIVNQKWLETIGKRFGAPDVVVGGVMKMVLSEEDIIGKTHIVPTSNQGKKIGVVDVEFTRGEQPKIVCRTFLLGKETPEDPLVISKVRGGATPTLSSVTTPPVKTVAEKGQANYYPPSTCKMCHDKQYKDWEKSAHAHAIKTIVDDGRMTAECMTCHSENFRRTGSKAVPEDSIGGVECATCHYSVLPHGMERNNNHTKVKVDPKLCLTCHTKEQSPDYNQDSYFRMVTHGK